MEKKEREKTPLIVETLFCESARKPLGPIILAISDPPLNANVINAKSKYKICQIY